MNKFVIITTQSKKNDKERKKLFKDLDDLILTLA